MVKLTPKQTKFCEYVVSGLSYKDSYIKAYNTKCSEQVAMNEGSKLALRTDIQEHIKTISKPLEQAAQIQGLNERTKQIQEIQERIQICKDKQDEQSLIRYYDMLNKIYNLYKDTEQDQQQQNTLNNIDIDTLKKLTQ